MNEFDIEINGRSVQARILEFKEGLLEVEIDGTHHHLNVSRVEEGVYSFILEGKSYEFEVTNGIRNKMFQVSSRGTSWEVELVDAETRYARNRNKGSVDNNGKNTISSPMPGKVVRILVEVGQDVKEGDTVIIISAMKMESEYKSPRNATIKEILTEEGATIEGHQPLIILE